MSERVFQPCEDGDHWECSGSFYADEDDNLGVVGDIECSCPCHKRVLVTDAEERQ